MKGHLQSDVVSTALLQGAYPSALVREPALSTVRQPVPPAVRPRRPWPPLLPVLLPFLALAILALVVAHEFRTSSFQSGRIASHAQAMRWQLGPGRSEAVVFPQGGPFDVRLGYARLPGFLERLDARGFAVRQQARFSPEMLAFAKRGYFPPYPEKIQAGLTVRDSFGEPLYRFRYPQQGYASFEGIPPLVWRTLLFIENRDLLDTSNPTANPAVDWPRFATAAFWRAFKVAGISSESSAGASTLATQLEKYRHSPDGLTRQNTDKMRQMVSATVRTYRDGPDTLGARQRIVRDYLNSVPLSAFPGYGEVNGMADGLRVWFGADFEKTNLALDPDSAAPIAARALALRQVLSLTIAQRRPSYYLSQGRADLALLVDSHLRVLIGAGIVDAELGKVALDQRVLFADEWNSPPEEVPAPPNAHSRATNVARAHLSGLLDVPLYDLDRMDVEASTTLHTGLQGKINEHLRALAEPEYAAAAGLIGEHLLAPAVTGDVRYSFTLYERTGDSYRVRVQTDSTAQAFDINEHSKLELGSTAKLRVLTTYLQIVSEIHAKYANLSAQELRALDVAPDDLLTRWAVDWLAAAKDRDLSTMLHAALERRYSASPWESFFTGGGMHTFANFRHEDDYRNPTLREALRDSVNLPFIRLLRDLVRWSIHEGAGGNRAALFVDDTDPGRQEYLARFADREGTTYLSRFWKRYRGKDAQQRFAEFLARVHPTESRYAAVHRYLSPEAVRPTFAAFMAASLPNPKRTPERVDELYRTFARGEFSLADQAYVAGVHPLELWLVSYLLQRPDASFADAVAASREERQQIYAWLMKSRHKAARDSRVRIMLEEEAFHDIHRRWAELGYPFEKLVPSLATAIGSSGDRPAALAELMGVIRNDGMRLPTVRIDRVRFGAGTPYETLVEHEGRAKRVMPAEVAAALRVALADVVLAGTARRLNGSFVTEDGRTFVVGGKTGTGDNRIEAVGRGGAILSSTAVNRTATFVFYLGDNHVGTITAFVPGAAAEKFSFTSALPVQVLKSMAPLLVPYLDGGEKRTPLPGTLMAAAPAAPASGSVVADPSAIGPPAPPVVAQAPVAPLPADPYVPAPAPVPPPPVEDAFAERAPYDVDAEPAADDASRVAGREETFVDQYGRTWTEAPASGVAGEERTADADSEQPAQGEWYDEREPEYDSMAGDEDADAPSVDADSEAWIDGDASSDDGYDAERSDDDGYRDDEYDDRGDW